MKLSAWPVRAIVSVIVADVAVSADGVAELTDTPVVVAAVAAHTAG